ncbi:MAG: hypothetical protein ISF22_07595 [Methanomassiliicoccus sp.]|nr:hypothetical protein [Methanomassiliicoccus sp.]
MSLDLKSLGPYEENVVWDFDQVNNEIPNLSIISDGRIRDHTGKWIDDQTMELGVVGRQKEEGATEDVTISIVAPNEVRGHIVGRMGDRPMTVIDYVLSRI